MRQHPQTIPAVTIALDRDAELHSDKAPVERAVEVIECLAGRGFEIVPKPLPGSTAHDRVEFARRTGCWDGVSDKDYMAWARSLVPGSFVIRTVEELTTENKKAWFASVEALYRDKGVPTGRVLEVVYAKPDGTTETVRHAEVVRTDAVSYDPPPIVGGTVAKATVLRATETVALQPGNVLETWIEGIGTMRNTCR